MKKFPTLNNIVVEQLIVRLCTDEEALNKLTNCIIEHIGKNEKLRMALKDEIGKPFGPTGSIGVTGPAGLAGQTGPIGLEGATGPIGPEGYADYFESKESAED